MCKSAPKFKKATIILTRWVRRCYSARFFFLLLKKAAHWMVYSLEKCNCIFFHGPPFHRKCGKNIWKTFFLTLSEGLADSRMERINSRCEGAQGNSETFFCLSLLNVHEDKINICVWCTAQLLNRGRICTLKLGSMLLFHYHWQLWLKLNHCFNLHMVFKECYSSILDDLSTLSKQALVHFPTKTLNMCFP